MEIELVPATEAHLEALIDGREVEWTVAEGWMEFPEVLPLMLKWLRDGTIHEPWTTYFLIDPATQTLIGGAGFKGGPDGDGVVEIGYGIARAWRGKDLATEAARRLTEMAFANGAKRVRAHTLPQPGPSPRVLEKLGFAPAGEANDPDEGRVWRWEKGREVFSPLDTFRALRDARLRDPHRPLWHLTCPEEGHAMPFDPNGAIFWKGRYHLFYIFQRTDGAHCWGHVSSIDLLHWRQHPTALDVAPDDPDRGIFSGNAFLDRDGVPTILYHGVGVGNCIAQASDDLLEAWVKLPSNPIVPAPQPGDPGHGVWESWDPHGWFEDGQYHAIFGGKKAALFQGPELTQMTYRGPFLVGDTLSDDEDDISCPDFFAIGDRHALIAISHQKGIRWWTGQWDGTRFVAEKHDRVTWPGGTYFAPESFVDGHGRRILWGWAWDPRPYDPARGWSGVMAQPVQVLLREDGGLAFTPVNELERLRLNGSEHTCPALSSGAEMVLDGVRGDSLELALTVQPGDARRITLSVRRSPDGAERTDIVYDANAGTLTIDLRNSGDPEIHHHGWVAIPPRDAEARDRRHVEQQAPFTPETGGPLQLRVFLDRSLVEVFASDGRYLMQRIFPIRPESPGVALRADGGATGPITLHAWELAATNAF